jgi:hypothetical protein
VRKCASCPNPVTDPGTKRCRACYRALGAPHPLREWRERTGTSFAKLAEKARLDVRTVERVASGAVNPSGPVLMKLSQATGLEVVVLMRGTRWT